MWFFLSQVTVYFSLFVSWNILTRLCLSTWFTFNSIQRTSQNWTNDKSTAWFLENFLLSLDEGERNVRNLAEQDASLLYLDCCVSQVCLVNLAGMIISFIAIFSQDLFRPRCWWCNAPLSPGQAQPCTQSIHLVTCTPGSTVQKYGVRDVHFYCV